MKITAELKFHELSEEYRLTGRWQRGDFSWHPDFSPLTGRVYSSYESFMKDIDYQNRNAAVISHNELAKCLGFKNGKQMSKVYEECY